VDNLKVGVHSYLIQAQAGGAQACDYKIKSLP
jgi:hypothetical protein